MKITADTTAKKNQILRTGTRIFNRKLYPFMSAIDFFQRNEYTVINVIERLLQNKENKEMKKRYFIPACVLSAAAVGFVFFAMGHPELSFPWGNRVTGILYGGYADVVVLLFILAFYKKVTCLNILTIIFELGAVFFLVQSLLGLFPNGQVNWYLPLALGLNCIAIFLNLAQQRKNKKSDKKRQIKIDSDLS